MRASAHGSSDARALWRAVVRQAIADATARARTSRALKDRAEARAWLRSGDADFYRVCALAEIEPEYLQRVALRAIAEADATPRASPFARPPGRRGVAAVCDG